MITALLIDDDKNLRNGMKILLSKYATEIKIVGEAESVKSGVLAIENLNPQVIFIDIDLGDGTGFDILEQVAVKNNGKIKSHVVFVTAHDQYAVKAFKFSALDYLLKPVDLEELQNVVRKIKSVISQTSSYEHINLLLENINKKTTQFKRIALSTADGTHLLNIEDIIRCESIDNYTKFFLKDNQSILIAKTLKEYEELLIEHGFERIHQSHLINLACVKSYMKNSGGFVIMIDDAKIPVSQRKKEGLIERLKNV